METSFTSTILTQTTTTNEESIAINKTSNAEQSSKYSEDQILHQRNNYRMVQNILLVWLDSNIDNNKAEYRDTITQMRQTINNINTFIDIEECIQFIDNMHDNQICLIASGSLGQQLVPRVHNMYQVDSIFIFCGNKKYHEPWAKLWPKMKGVFTDISPICEGLKQVAQQCEQNAISISFVDTNYDLSKKNLNQLDSMFMYSQILKEILSTIQFDDEHMKEYINHCRIIFDENDAELQKMNQLETNYHQKTPIWWYTSECFLYSMLNRVLRLMELDIIIKMSFFIGDLHLHIQQLHSEQFCDNKSSQVFTVYRGQGLPRKDFERMKKIQGGLMSFNNFLSTSKDPKVSLDFASGALPNTDMIGILFIMTIDPTKSTTPFASIVDVGYYKDKKDEVLFSMHTVFRIGHIAPMDENQRLFQVKLTLASDSDEDLRLLTDRIREESHSSTKGLYRLGLFMNTMGQFVKSQELFEILLEQTTDENEKGSIYHMLGWAKYNQGEYNEAIIFYDKALEIRQELLPPNHPDLGASYYCIGLIYENMGNYSKALSYYEKALEVQQQLLPPNHPDIGLSYNNIGNMYNNMGDYVEALSYHEKVLEIQQESLPPNHPTLGVSYNSIGDVYKNMDNHSEALSYYEKALEIRKQSLSSNHPSLVASCRGIGIVYHKMGVYPKALSYHEKAFKIQQQSLPPNHPDLVATYNNNGMVHASMGDYPKALSYYEKALKIQQELLPPNHPDIGLSYNNIGIVCCKMNDYAKAISYCEKAIKIEEQQLRSSNDSQLGNSYNTIGWVYCKMGEYEKALSYCEKAVEIHERLLPSHHTDLGNSYNTIGEVYLKISQYSKALSFCKKAIAIQEQTLPPDHPDLCAFYHNIAEVYEKLGNYSKTISCYKRAVDIAQNSLPSNHPDLKKYMNNLEHIKQNM